MPLVIIIIIIVVVIIGDRRLQDHLYHSFYPDT